MRMHVCGVCVCTHMCGTQHHLSSGSKSNFALTHCFAFHPYPSLAPRPL